MTANQIRQIAEEFASMKNFTPGFHKEERELAKLFEQFIHYVQIRYCVVEKSVVEKEYQDSKESYERNKGDEDYFEGYWEGRVDSYEDIFGSETFNQNEE